MVVASQLVVRGVAQELLHFMFPKWKRLEMGLQQQILEEVKDIEATTFRLAMNLCN